MVRAPHTPTQTGPFHRNKFSSLLMSLCTKASLTGKAQSFSMMELYSGQKKIWNRCVTSNSIDYYVRMSNVLLR